MYIYIYAYVYVYIYTYIYRYIYIYINTCINKCTCRTICTYLSVCLITSPGAARGARAAPATCTTLLWIRALDFLMGPKYLASPAMGNHWENHGKTMGKWWESGGFI